MSVGRYGWVVHLLSLCGGTLSARADTIISLLDVTMADGATASGTFVLNVDGYLSSASIVTTASTDSLIQAETFSATGGGVPSVAPNGFDSLFQFSSTDGRLGLTLETASPVSLAGGIFSLDLQPGVNAYFQSGEYCLTGYACPGLTYLQGTVASGGALDAPEPASLGLLAVAGVVLPALRRRRAGAVRATA